MAMIKTTSVVAVLWVILIVGIGMEKCRGEDLSPSKEIPSGKYGSGVDAEEKEARFKKAKEIAEEAFKEAREIWSKMTAEEKERAKAALKEAREKAGVPKGHQWSKEAIEGVEAALKEAKEKSKNKADAEWIDRVDAAIKEAKTEKAKAEAATPLPDKRNTANR